MQQLSKNGKHRITKRHILKVLFLARERLPDGSNIKRDLAYYWYMEGPYSEVVDANLTLMVADGLVRVYKTNKSQTYQLMPERSLHLVVADADLDAARHEIGLVANENTDVRDAVERTYETAPSKWYATYNLRFKPQFEEHCKDMSAGRESRYANRDILEWLEDSVLDYPTVPEFLEHRMIFMDFAKMANAFLRRDLHHAPRDTLKWFSDLCSSMWDTFAYGVRVHHHDPQYDTHIEKWTEMYDDALDKLEHETAERMEQFGDVGVVEPDLAPEMEDMVLHPERHEFTLLSLDDITSVR